MCLVAYDTQVSEKGFKLQFNTQYITVYDTDESF